MRVIIDAQLPSKLSELLKDTGIDAIHTDDFPLKEITSDEEIRIRAMKENRIVITKDHDFVSSYLLKKIPRKLLLISTGNITNKKLFSIVLNNLIYIKRLFTKYDYLELDNDGIIVHE